MGTHRFISTSFWSDQWIQELDPSEKYLYMYLLTNPYTNISGVYKIGYKQISFDTGYNQDTIKGIIDKFSKHGKAYRMGQYIILPNWPKHQNWKKKETIKQGIIKELNLLTNEELIFLYQTGYKFELKEIFEERGVSIPTIPLSYPYDTPTVPAILSDSILSDSILSDSILSDSILDSCSPKSNQPEPQDSPTACAVDQKGLIPVSPQQNKIAPISQPPTKKRGITLTDDQKPLFHAAKACFEADEKTKALMYQDRGSTQMYMENLKLFVVRCHNIAPGITADFMKTVLDHFRVLCGGRLKAKNVEFTPRSLITSWIWEMVIGSMPKADDELTERIRASIKGMFK